MDRFTRVPNHTGLADRVENIPFDPQEHEWGIECKFFDEQFSLEQCFQAAEDILTHDDGQILRNAIWNELKKRLGTACDEFEIESCVLTFIQLGGHQSIFEARSNVKIGEEREEIKLVIGVSRAQGLNPIVQGDHEKITELHHSEAVENGVDPYSIEAQETETYPMHYGGVQTQAGPYAWVSEFCEGYMEVNAAYADAGVRTYGGDGTQRIILLNGLNQGFVGYAPDEIESTELRRRVFEHQIKTAARCSWVLSPSFQAGDYLYNPDTDRLMLHCFRDFFALRERVFKTVTENPTLNDVQIRAAAVAMQLVQIILKKDRNLTVSGDEYRIGESDEEYYMYGPTDILEVVSRLSRDESVMPQSTGMDLLSGFTGASKTATLAIEDLIEREILYRRMEAAFAVLLLAFYKP